MLRFGELCTRSFNITELFNIEYSTNQAKPLKPKVPSNEAFVTLKMKIHQISLRIIHRHIISNLSDLNFLYNFICK